MAKPSNPAPTVFQKPTAMKHRIGHLYAVTHGAAFAALVVVPRFEADQRERHHFQRREHGADCDDRGRRAGPVQVVQRAEDAAEQEHDGLGDDGAVGAGRLDQPEAREDQRDDGGGEHLEEALDPRCTSHQRQYSIIE